ncbi:hypothetical protein [Geodermatophilus sp. SYSU D00700]
MYNRKALRFVAGVLMAIGCLLLLLPLSARATADAVGCGSALDLSGREATEQFLDDLESNIDGGGLRREDIDWRALCADRIETQRMIAWPLVVAGGLALLYLNGQTPKADSRFGRRSAQQEPEGNESKQ